LLKGGSPKDQEAQILPKDVINMAVVEDSQKALTHTYSHRDFPYHEPLGFFMGRHLRSGLRQTPFTERVSGLSKDF